MLSGWFDAKSTVTWSNAVFHAVRDTSPITVQRSLMRWVTLIENDAGRVTVALPLLSTKVPGAVCASSAAVSGVTVKLALPPVILCSTFER
ncbi:hypothetical protein D9M71_621910 [compost metagenome]